MSTLAIIQARYSSTRFPGKVLTDLNGKIVLEHVIERALRIRGVNRVAVALPDGESQAPLVEWCRANCPRLGAGVMQGVGLDENDVLGRFRMVAQWAKSSLCVRLTADCPAFEPVLVDRLLMAFYRSTRDIGYAWIDTSRGDWADGLDAEVFTTRALMDMVPETESDKEHVTPVIRRSTGVLSLPFDEAYRGWPKLSIDTPEDLERVREWAKQH